MVQYCCVPGCKSNALNAGVSFHAFPKDKELRKTWEVKIRRDEKRNKQLSPSMKVCSKHFKESDYRDIVCGTRNCLKEKAVPSVFSFTSPRKIKKPRRKIHYLNVTPIVNCNKQPPNTPVPVLSEMEETAVSSLLMLFANSTDANAEPTVDTTDTSAEPTSLPSEGQDLSELVSDLKHKLEQVQRSNVVLEAIVEELQQELTQAKRVIKEMEMEKEMKVKTVTARCDFSMDKVKHSDYLTYYTGFDSVEMYEAFSEFVNPGQKTSYSQKIPVEDQLLLVLSKLRQGLDNVDLAFRFNTSVKLVSKIFTNFINDFYYRLGCLNIWPHRQIILDNAPPVFKEKYPTTIIILDGTEMKIESPTSLLLQSQSFSTYKSSNTVKGLVGCDPKGGITFISQLYAGSISDKKITEASGLYDVLREKLENNEVLPGDVVMVDKGFNIKKEIESLGLNLNVPPMASNEQFEESEVYETRKIASYRVHVERAIRRVKTFKILNGVIPITTLPHLNQVWTVCCILSGFRCVTKSNRSTPPTPVV